MLPNVPWGELHFPSLKKKGRVGEVGKNQIMLGLICQSKDFCPYFKNQRKPVKCF